MNRDSLPEAVVDNLAEDSKQARDIASRLLLPLLRPDQLASLPGTGFILSLGVNGLSLQQLGKKAPGPISVDFAAGSVAHRRKFGGGKGQMIAKAVGLNKGSGLAVFDATAGLGKDAFVLASLGCRVTLTERNPVVAELLADGIARAENSDDGELIEIIQRMTLLREDSLSYLSKMAANADQVDVVYLDPMFPIRSKSASVKKDMAVFHSLVGQDHDADSLLSLALAAARYRVAVKRPSQAPFLDEREPTYQLTGKTSRYDIYVNAKIEH